MKINGKVISKTEYDAMAKTIPPISKENREKLKKTIYDQLGREINNPTPVFINDPEDLSKPLTINGKILRILQMRQSQHLERQIESPEDLEDFGVDESQQLNETEYQVVELEDPDLQDISVTAAAGESEGNNSPPAAPPAGSEDGGAPSSDSAGISPQSGEKGE